MADAEVAAPAAAPPDPSEHAEAAHPADASAPSSPIANMVHMAVDRYRVFGDYSDMGNLRLGSTDPGLFGARKMQTLPSWVFSDLLRGVIKPAGPSRGAWGSAKTVQILSGDEVPSVFPCSPDEHTKQKFSNTILPLLTDSNGKRLAGCGFIIQCDNAEAGLLYFAFPLPASGACRLVWHSPAVPCPVSSPAFCCPQSL
jgi:hypothetical protein